MNPTLTANKFSGITASELITELQQGIRLPPPQSCPSSISGLIQKCFIEQPTERPTFAQVKHSIEIAFQQLSQVETPAARMETNAENNLHYADVHFEEKYLDMKAKNRKYQEDQIIGEHNTPDIVLDGQSLTASFKNKTEQDISRPFLRSSINDLSLLKIPGPQKYLLDDQMNLVDGTNTGNCHSLSPASTGHKRFFSYGGEDLTPPLQPDKRTSNPISSSQSHPNPTYMMFLDDMKEKEPGACGTEPCKEEFKSLKSLNM